MLFIKLIVPAVKHLTQMSSSFDFRVIAFLVLLACKVYVLSWSSVAEFHITHRFTSLENKYKPPPAVADALVTCPERDGARKQYPRLTFPLDSTQKTRRT